MRWLAMFLALLLTGCATIPSAGPVEEVPLPEVPRGIDIAPQPPQAGADPARILEGFLLAMTDAEGDYEVAREYLTAEASARWDPSVSTTVYSGDVVEAGDGLELAGQRVGTLSRQGHFTAGGGDIEHDFGLVRVNDEWRIANPPDGVILNRYLFERFYEQLTVYYMSRTGTHVVPDLLSVPEAAVSPAQIVEAQIEGPGEQLLGAVMNAVPAGTQLAPEGATVGGDGVVTVALTGLRTGLSEQARRRLGAQLMWSLTALPRVTGLRILNDGIPFPVPGESADGVLELATQQNYQVLTRSATQDLYGVSAEVPGRFVETRLFLPLRSDLPRAAEIAMSLDGGTIAVVGAERTAVHVGPVDGELVEVTGYTQIREAQFVLGELYAVAADDHGETQVIKVSRDGQVVDVDADLPEGARLAGISIDQSGVVAAVTVRTADRMLLGRMTLFSARRLEQFLELPIVSASGAPVTEIADVQWNSESNLVVAAGSSEEQEIYILRADGSMIEDLASVTAHIAEVAALPRPGGGLIALRGGNGEVWRYTSPSQWTMADFTVASITFAG